MPKITQAKQPLVFLTLTLATVSLEAAVCDTLRVLIDQRLSTVMNSENLKNVTRLYKEISDLEYSTQDIYACDSENTNVRDKLSQKKIELLSQQTRASWVFRHHIKRLKEYQVNYNKHQCNQIPKKDSCINQPPATHSRRR